MRSGGDTMNIDSNKRLSKTKGLSEGVVLSVTSSAKDEQHPRNKARSSDAHPITTQPNTVLHFNAGGWMKIPKNVPNCTPGLECLAMLDQLFIKQGVCLTQGQTYKFVVKNNQGQGVYWAVEDTDCITHYCCGSIRPFDIKIWDIHQNEVIHFNRPFACTTCCCFRYWYFQSIEISSPPGHTIGRVIQTSTYFYSNFDVKNHMNETVLRIKGPRVIWRCFRDIDFKIISLDGTEVGRISKQWPGLTADYFGISFPMDLDVRMKAVLLGACMLINSIFYESTKMFIK